MEKLDKMENGNESNQSKIENDSGENKVENESGKTQVENESGKNQVENESGKNQVENESGKNQVENESGKNQVENESGKKQVENESGKNQVENESGKNQVENESGKKQVENESGKNQVENESGKNQVENESGKRADKSDDVSETHQSVPILMSKETSLECWLCGADHSTKECPRIAAAHKVRDKPVPSRARVTLPDSLLIVKLEDPLKRLMVVAKTSLPCNTMFGPLEAPKVKDTKDHIGYKIFDEEEGTFALDCSNENNCNWMSLVNFSSNINKNNLVAYQLNKLIYFISIKEINPGEELLVSFSKVYRKKIDQITGTVPEEISVESISEIIEILDPFRYYSNILKDGPKTVIYIEEDEIENNLQETISQKLACLNNQTSSTIAKVNVSKAESLQLSKVSSTNTVQQLGANRSNFQLSALAATTVKLPSTMKFLGSSSSISNLGSNSSSTQRVSAAQTNVKQLIVSGTSKTINSPRPFQLMGDSSSTKSPSTPLKTNQASTLNARRLSDSLSSVKPAITQNTVKIINIVSKSPPRPTSDIDAGMDNDDDSDISWKPEENEENEQSSKEIRRSSRKRKTVATVEALLSKHRKLVPDTKKPEPVANKLQLLGKNLVPVVKKLDSSDFFVKKKAGLVKVDISPAKYEARGKGKAEKCIEQYKINFAKELVKKSGHGCLGITVETESWTCSVCDSTFEDCIDLAFHLKSHFEANTSRRKRKKQSPKLEGEADNDDDSSEKGYIYTCDLCTSKVTDKLEILRHLQKHTGEFYCRLCEKVFTHLNTVKNHNCTANPQEWICDVCNKVLATREALKYHRYCYHSKPRFTCEKCGEKFLFKSRLRVHTSSCKAAGKSGESPPKKNNKSSYECKPCKKIFYSRTRYEKHLPKHTGEFACQFCGKWLSSKPSLKEHVVICMTQNVVGNNNNEEQVLDENGQIACSYCNEIFFDLVVYRTHFYHHSYPFECQICGFRAKLNLELDQHVCIEREFKCKVCNSTFFAFCNLKEHRIKENHHDPPPLPEKELEELKSQSFLCDLCGESFKTKMKLKCHSLLHKEKRFSCKVCHKKIRRKKDWERHELTHRERSVPCPYCSNLFKSRNSLLVHIRGHEGIRKYSCPFCDKTFMQKGNLNKHLDTHDKNKRYYCSFCPKDFSSKDSIRDHEKIHKFGKNFKCEICFKPFLKAHQLRKHMLNHGAGQRYTCRYCGVVIKFFRTIKSHLIRKHSDCESEWKDPEVIKSMLGEYTVSDTKNKQIRVRKKDEHTVSATKKKRINVRKRNADDSSDISSTSEEEEDFDNYSDDSNNKGGKTSLTITEISNQNEEMESEAPSTLIYLAENCANLNNHPQSHYEEKSIQHIAPENQYQNDNIFTHTDFNTGEVVIVSSVEEPQQEYEERVISSDFLVHQEETDNLVMYVDTVTG